MRILAITHNFPNEGNRNHGIFAARQLLEMKNQGADITVLVPLVWCPGFLRNFKRWRIYNHNWKCEYKSIKALSIPYLRLPGRWFYPWAGRSVFHAIRNKAVELHKENPFDVIYARFFFPDGYAALRLSRVMGIPVVAVGAGDDVNVDPHFSKIVYRDFVKQAKELDGIIASGHRVADNIDAVSNKRALPVHGVVDLQTFAPISDKSHLRQELGLPPDKFVILYAGTYKATKGLYELIDAVERISKEVPNIVLKICGYGRQESRMRSVIKQKALENVIDIVGLVDPSEMHKWMQSADMFVLPSYEEGMPNAVMEAMACGLPVVASSVGGLPEDIGDCEGAILVQPRSVDALEQGMLKVIENEQLRARMEAAARKRAEERFGVERNARIVLNYLRKVVEEHRVKKPS